MRGPTWTYKKTSLGKGILAFIASGPYAGVVTGNSVAVAGDEGVLVVD